MNNNRKRKVIEQIKKDNNQIGVQMERWKMEMTGSGNELKARKSKRKKTFQI